MIAQEVLGDILTCFAVVTLVPVKAAVQFFTLLISDTLRPTSDLLILLHLALVRGLCVGGGRWQMVLWLWLWLVLLLLLLLRRPIWKQSLVFVRRQLPLALGCNKTIQKKNHHNTQ